MAWEPAVIAFGTETIRGFVRRGETVEATIPWRADISVDTVVEIDGARHTIASVRDPGSRHEILELGLEPTAPRQVRAEPRASKRRERKSGAKAEASNAT